MNSNQQTGPAFGSDDIRHEANDQRHVPQTRPTAENLAATTAANIPPTIGSSLEVSTRKVTDIADVSL